MARYVAFLRGINVSNRRATSDQLCSCLVAVGFSDVSAFRASGNVIFSSDGGDGDERDLSARVEEAMLGSLGYEVPVFLRSEAEVAAVAAHQPFPPADVEGSDGKLQVLFLQSPPPEPARKRALGHSTDVDRLAISGRELYWLPSGRMLESELDLKAIAATLGPGTMRTKGTVEQIASKYFAS